MLSVTDAGRWDFSLSCAGGYTLIADGGDGGARQQLIVHYTC